MIHAPSSTKNQSGERDPEMHRPKKGNDWYFGMKAHIGVDAESGFTPTAVPTPANANDVTHAHALLCCDVTDVSVTPVTKASRSGARIKAKR